MSESITPSDWALMVAQQAISIGACQNHLELAAFLELVRAESPRVVIEVGTSTGGTFWALCQSAPLDATLLSLDLGPLHPHGHAMIAHDDLVMLRKHPKQRVIGLHADSQLEETRDRLDALFDGQADVLFIDADHRYEYVKRDHELYAPLVKQGGIVGFHDISQASVGNDPEYATEVSRFWEELTGELDKHWSAVASPGTYGIGAYRR